MTFETYYPAPFGVYNEMRAKRMAVGDNYYNGSQFYWPSGGGSGNIDADADLIVEGSVGIGTTSPQNKLHISGDGIGYGESDDPVIRVNVNNTVRQAAIRFTANNDLSSRWEIGRSGSSQDSGNLYLYHGSDTDARVLTATPGGNVGIGTVNPTAKLEVAGGDNSFAWGGDHSNNGYVRIGNVQICWGNGVAVDYPGYTNWYIKATTIQFPSGCQFKDNNYSLTATPTATSTNGKAFVGPYAYSRSTTSAWVLFHKISDASQEDPTAEGPVPFTWMAIGTWK